MTADPGHAPLIITALLPGDLHRQFTRLRTTHFPAERNYLEAHVTLFHALPYIVEGEVRGVLAQAARDTAPVAGRIEGLMSLGGGTAIRLTSPALASLRDRLAERFHGLLTAQDSHRPRFHVTIQNKVTSQAARQLQQDLAGTIEPRDFVFRGLGLWAYLGGPWRALGSYPFRANGAARR